MNSKEFVKLRVTDLVCRESWAILRILPATGYVYKTEALPTGCYEPFLYQSQFTMEELTQLHGCRWPGASIATLAKCDWIGYVE